MWVLHGKGILFHKITFYVLLSRTRLGWGGASGGVGVGAIDWGEGKDKKTEKRDVGKNWEKSQQAFSSVGSPKSMHKDCKTILKSPIVQLIAKDALNGKFWSVTQKKSEKVFTNFSPFLSPNLVILQNCHQILWLIFWLNHYCICPRNVSQISSQFISPYSVTPKNHH